MPEEANAADVVARGQECGLEHQNGQVGLGNAHRDSFFITAFGLGILQGSPGDKGADDKPRITTHSLPIAILRQPRTDVFRRWKCN